MWRRRAPAGTPAVGAPPAARPRPFRSMREPPLHVDVAGRNASPRLAPERVPRRVEVEVQVLGPVAVVGAARPFRRPWALELVVYLALHRGGAASDGWATALWPERVMADPTRHSTVSAARRSLGRSSDGHDHLPRRRGALRLAPTVGCDWDRFLAMARAEDPVAWRAGLSLVRGRPFDGLRNADWTVLEGVGARIEDEVVQAALRLSDHLLRAGDGHGAELAARRGLLVSPYDERLYRALLQAADRQGNPAGVESAMAELVRLVSGQPAGWGAARAGSPGEVARWVHPETARLYGALSRRRCLAGTGGTAGPGTERLPTRP